MHHLMVGQSVELPIAASARHPTSRRKQETHRPKPHCFLLQHVLLLKYDSKPPTLPANIAAFMAFRRFPVPVAKRTKHHADVFRIKGFFHSFSSFQIFDQGRSAAFRTFRFFAGPLRPRMDYINADSINVHPLFLSVSAFQLMMPLCPGI